MTWPQSVDFWPGQGLLADCVHLQVRSLHQRSSRKARAIFGGRAEDAVDGPAKWQAKSQALLQLIVNIPWFSLGWKTILLVVQEFTTIHNIWTWFGKLSERIWAYTVYKLWVVCSGNTWNNIWTYESFHKWGIPKMDGLQWKIPI